MTRSSFSALVALLSLIVTVAACSSVSDPAPAAGDDTNLDAGSPNDATTTTNDSDDAATSNLDAAANDAATFGAPDANAAADANAEADARAASTTLNIPAANVTVSVSFDVSLTADATGTSVTYDDKSAHDSDIGSISISHGVGTFMFRGAPAQAFASTQTIEPGASNDPSLGTDYQLLARQESRLIIVYLRCFGTSLEQMYYESTDGHSTHEEVVLATAGTCASTNTATGEAVSFAATALIPPVVHPGATITGTGISFDGTGPGAVKIMGSEWALYPFQTVDCSECEDPGWYELHSILWNPATSEACFTVGYLQASDTTHVDFDYLRCLPTGDDLGTNGEGAAVAATWTVDTTKFDAKSPTGIRPKFFAR